MRRDLIRFRSRWPAATLGVFLLAAVAGACNFDVANPNSPDPIGPDPTRAQVQAAVTGILIAARSDAADFILDVGIMGREAYRFDGSDPRFTSELLTGSLDAGSRAFGGDHWAEEYRTIRGANVLLGVIQSASILTPQEINGVIGFAQTMKAEEFVRVLVGHTQDSIPIAVQTDPTAPPAPFVSNVAAYNYVVVLLDSAQTSLQAAGATFPFTLSSGFAGFDTPSSFLEFNRALMARVEVYRGNWVAAQTALDASFVDTLTADLNLGVFHTFSTGSGDLTNPLLAAENYAHPALQTDAQLQTGGVLLDRRFLEKTTPRASATVDGLTSALGWALYSTTNAPVPIIRNEELILLRADAFIGQNNLTAARDYLNYIRVHSGGLDPIATPADQASAITALLYERRYSLLFEGGHRWIDTRRYGHLTDLPLDRPGDVVYSTFPIPTAEVQARQ